MEPKKMTFEEVKELFYKTHVCNYDDPDKEEGRIQKYAEENNIEITD